MKLIDILNLIAKGELEEGTKIKVRNKIYRFGKDDYSGEHSDLFYEDSDGINNCFFDECYLDPALNEEVEIIGDATNVLAKIEELRIDIFNCEALDCENEILRVADKLNEVIRELNRRSE